MDDFIIVIKKDFKVRNKIKDMLDRYNRLSYNYQSKTGYDTLVQNVFPKELIYIRSTTITEIDIELKMKNSRIEYSESKKTHNFLKESDNHLYSKSCDDGS